MISSPSADATILMIVGIAFLMWAVFLLYSALEKERKRWYEIGLKKGKDLGIRALKEQEAELRRQYFSQTWTHIAASGEDLHLFINGREVPSEAITPVGASYAIKTKGFWYHDGHIRGGFTSHEILKQPQLERFYMKDMNKLKEMGGKTIAIGT